MATTLDELLVGLGFDYDPEDLEEFNKDMKSLTNTVKAFAKVVVAGTVALVGFATVTTAVTDKQGKLSNQIGVSVEQIDALEFALKRAGGEGSALGNSLQQLSIRLSEASRGIGSGVEAFGILGISVTDANGKLKATDDVLLEVSDSLQRFSKAQQIELADKLGLRDSILLLQEGSDGIRALTDEAKAFGVTTKEDAAFSADFQDSLVDILQIGKQLSRVFTRSLVPVLENIANSITEWFKANRDVIQQNIPKFIDKVTFALKLLTLASLAFISIKLVNVLVSLITLFRSLSIAALLANAAIAALPLLIAGSITVIGLLAEDAKTFFEDGESFIGKMIKQFPEWADQIKIIASIFATVAKVTTLIFEGWKGLFNLFLSDTFIEDFKRNLIQIGRDIDNVFKEAVDSVSNFFDNLWTDIATSFNDNVVKPIMDVIQDIIDSFPKFDLFGIFGDEPTTNVNVNGQLNNLPPLILNIDDVPILDDIKLIVEDLPDVILNVDDVPVFNGLISDQANRGLNSIENISKDSALTNNNESQINIGDIKVTVTSTEQNAAETGRIVANSIREQLEPIFQQASKDLNSVVEL